MTATTLWSLAEFRRCSKHRCQAPCSSTQASASTQSHETARAPTHEARRKAGKQPICVQRPQVRGTSWSVVRGRSPSEPPIQAGGRPSPTSRTPAGMWAPAALQARKCSARCGFADRRSHVVVTLSANGPGDSRVLAIPTRTFITRAASQIALPGLVWVAGHRLRAAG